MSRPAWIDKYFAEQFADAAAAKDWMRSRPDTVKLLLRQFPAGCVVKLKCDRCHLKAGTYCIVTGYNEQGLVHIQDGPDANCYHKAPAHELELVECLRGASKEDVERMLA